MLNIVEFMNTELGKELKETILCWDNALEEQRKVTSLIEYKNWEKICISCMDKWEVFKLVLKQFCGIEVCFTRTDEYYGICTEDETLWLMKEYREYEGGKDDAEI